MFNPMLNIKINTIAEAVYRHLGPGLPVKVYKESFIHELEMAEIHFVKDPFVPINYKGQILDAGLNACFLIDSKIVLYFKCSSRSSEYHKRQLHNYMKLSVKRCGMILDFNSVNFSKVMRVFMC